MLVAQPKYDAERMRNFSSGQAKRSNDQFFFTDNIAGSLQRGATRVDKLQMAASS